VVLDKLRLKIAQIEDLSNQMLELHTKNEDLEVKIKLLENQSYDRELFEDAKKNRTIVQLTSDIQERAAALD
jgi:cell division protein FtsB